MFKKIFLLSFIALLFVFTVSITQAAGMIPKAGGDPCPDGQAAETCGNYELNDFIVLAINISKWILGIVGSLSLVMFIYGGLTFLISAGSPDTVGRAKKIIIAAVVGLIIVFSSYLIIKFVLSSMGVDWNGELNIAAHSGLIVKI